MYSVTLVCGYIVINEFCRTTKSGYCFLLKLLTSEESEDILCISKQWFLLGKKHQNQNKKHCLEWECIKMSQLNTVVCKFG